MVPANHLMETVSTPVQDKKHEAPQPKMKLSATESDGPPTTPRNASRTRPTTGNNTPQHPFGFKIQQQQVDIAEKIQKQASQSQPQPRGAKAKVHRSRDKENFLDQILALPGDLLAPIFEGAESNCSCLKISGADDSGVLAQRRASPAKQPGRARDLDNRGAR